MLRVVLPLAFLVLLSVPPPAAAQTLCAMDSPLPAAACAGTCPPAGAAITLRAWGLNALPGVPLTVVATGACAGLGASTATCTGSGAPEAFCQATFVSAGTGVLACTAVSTGANADVACDA
ncbi:MAG: hypothetical protein LC624_00720 [Halobacteriales archaeon]|nr:hypothetical protein [Halobacteriales archaeon]